jgi:dihydrofolate reductase
MRKITVAEFISLDGVVEAPDRWHFPYVNEEMYGVIGALSAQIDTMLLGRVTYQSYAGAFADAPADDATAAMMNRPAKVVVTKTLDELTWQNSTRLTGDLATEVAALKQRPGGDILVTGSISVARTLLRAGLVDELNLLIHPIIVGTGQRLFEEEGVEVPLRTISANTFSTGVVHLVCHPASQ